jgi:hypothetical protein
MITGKVEFWYENVYGVAFGQAYGDRPAPKVCLGIGLHDGPRKPLSPTLAVAGFAKGIEAPGLSAWLL